MGGGGGQVTVPQLEAWTFSRRARGRGKVGGEKLHADGSAGGLFEMEAGAGHEADRAGEGMYGETRSYSSGEGAAREGWMLICVFVCGRA